MQKGEEVGKQQAELQGLLAGVTAARHEQQLEQRQLARLQHQHEDLLQVSLCSVWRFVHGRCKAADLQSPNSCYGHSLRVQDTNQ